MRQGAEELSVALLARCGDFDELMDGAIGPCGVVANAAVLAAPGPVNELGTQEPLSD
jgi:hypothetical protein